VCPLIGLSAKECTDCVTSDMTQNQLKMQHYETEFKVRIDWGVLVLCAAVIHVRIICVWLSEPCHTEVIPSICIQYS
jgi:hypothetical protein